MRATLLLLASALFLATGCRHTPPREHAGSGETVVKARPASPPSKSRAAASAEDHARATPLNESSGKIASVNQQLRFVVIDFALNPMPKAGQDMAVYRQGQKVGEVRISSPARNSIVAADITSGVAQPGDEVRPD